MKPGLATISRGIVSLMGIAVVAVCAILLPELAREEAVGKASPPPTYPFLIGAWVLSIPIFFALYQTLKFISDIDKNKALSDRSVKALQNIKTCAIVFSILIILGALTIIILGKSAGEDVVPFVTLGFVVTFVSSIIATFAAVLKRLLQDAIAIKSENDLTV